MLLCEALQDHLEVRAYSRLCPNSRVLNRSNYPTFVLFNNADNSNNNREQQQQQQQQQKLGQQLTTILYVQSYYETVLKIVIQQHFRMIF